MQEKCKIMKETFMSALLSSRSLVYTENFMTLNA